MLEKGATALVGDVGFGIFFQEQVQKMVKSANASIPVFMSSLVSTPTLRRISQGGVIIMTANGTALNGAANGKLHEIFFRWGLGNRDADGNLTKCENALNNGDCADYHIYGMVRCGG